MDTTVAETKFAVIVLNYLSIEPQVIQNTRLRGGNDKKKIQGNFTCNLFISTQTQVRKAVDLAYSSAVRKRMPAVISSASEFVRPDGI